MTKELLIVDKHHLHQELVKIKRQTLDPELLLTDEEDEYDPSTYNDLSKMTERQRARYDGVGVLVVMTKIIIIIKN